jgi:hypothetical protein
LIVEENSNMPSQIPYNIYDNIGVTYVPVFCADELVRFIIYYLLLVVLE